LSVYIVPPATPMMVDDTAPVTGMAQTSWENADIEGDMADGGG
jgi:hypothetical protein